MAVKRIHNENTEMQLKAFRSRLGYVIGRTYGTNYAFSCRLGVHKDTVSKYVSGAAVPSLETLF